MPIDSPPDRPLAARDPRPRRHVLWVGRCGGLELTLARDAVAGIPGCTVRRLDAEWDDDAGPHPTCIVLVHERGGEWSPERALALSRRFPLVPIVAVAGSLADGRRRSGPFLAGIEEIAWHDLAGRLGAWFGDVETGIAGSIGLPPTARREDRILDAIRVSRPTEPPTRTPVSVVARDRTDLEGLVDLVRACGHVVEESALGRPAIDTLARVLVWDVRSIRPADLEWLRILAANRPGVAVVVLDSFPRGDSSAEALAAGAAAVLGRPVGLEVLAGTLASLAAARSA